MKISEHQVKFIAAIIDESSIASQTLKEDLIDHLCCVVEIKLENGIPFDIALQEALREIAPHGLDSLQNQTSYLLKSSKEILMKKMIFSIGFISAIAVSLGWLFLVLDWLGGRELFYYGLLGLLMIFIPMIAIHRYNVLVRKSLSEKLRILLGSVSGFIIGLSLVFKVLHLQGADFVLVFGVLLFTFGFLPLLFFNLYRKSVVSAAY